jgi:serine/threonine protein kinase
MGCGGSVQAGGSTDVAGMSSTREPISLPTELGTYNILGLIGEGAMARVYLVNAPKAGVEQYFALKVACKADLLERDKVQDVITERDVLASCSGGGARSFVLNLHAHFETPRFHFFALDYCNGGDLFEAQSTMFPGARMNEAAARFYLAECVLGVEVIHDAGWVVRDMKPENILVGMDGHVCISDFDLAVRSGREPAREELVGTAEYLSPEILQTVEKVGYKETCCASSVGPPADVWVLGAMLFEMMHGYSPFGRRPGEPIQKNRDRILKGETTVAKQMGRIRGRTRVAKGKKGKLSRQASVVLRLSSPCQQMIKSCLLEDATARPAVSALKSDPWFKGTSLRRPARNTPW